MAESAPCQNFRYLTKSSHTQVKYLLLCGFLNLIRSVFGTIRGFFHRLAGFFHRLRCMPEKLFYSSSSAYSFLLIKSLVSSRRRAVYSDLMSIISRAAATQVSAAARWKFRRKHLR